MIIGAHALIPQLSQRMVIPDIRHFINYFIVKGISN